jgi:hypothetical protein
MAYPVSTIPAAVEYLFTAFQTQLNTDATPENIVLSLGDPGMEDPPDLVQIANVSRSLEHFAMVGSGESLAMYEKYSVIWKISSVSRAATQPEAAAYLVPRVYQLMAYLEYAVRLDPSLGGIVLTAWPGQVEGGNVELAPDNNGYICELTGRVDCEATQ